MDPIRFAAMGNSTIIVVAIVYGFLLTLAGAAGFFGFLLWFMVTLSLWRYGYAVLRHVASGWNNFPPPDLESMNPFGGDFGVVFHSALFALLLYMLATTPFVDGWLRWLLLGGVLAVFPASAAIMALTRNAGAALSPASVTSLIRDLGGDYGRLLGVSVALGAFMALAGWLERISWALSVIGEMMAVWTVLALFLATGAAVRAHRSDFDLLESTDDAEQRDQRERQVQWQRTLDRAYASVRSGLPAQAYRTVRELIESEQDTLEIYQWTFNGMLAWDEPRHAVLLGERFAKRLWDAGRKVDALELAERCRKLSPQFVPPAAFAAELAAYARSIGRHRTADDLAALAAGGTAKAPS
jgi:hypothetical protein